MWEYTWALASASVIHLSFECCAVPHILRIQSTSRPTHTSATTLHTNKPRHTAVTREYIDIRLRLRLRRTNTPVYSSVCALSFVEWKEDRVHESPALSACCCCWDPSVVLCVLVFCFPRAVRCPKLPFAYSINNFQALSELKKPKHKKPMV